MLLTLDVGNTNITIGAYEDGERYFVSRMATDADRLEDQYAIELLNILNIYHISPERVVGVAIGSVVPKLTGPLVRGVKKLFGVDALNVSYDTVKDDLEVCISHKEATGADLIAACMAAKVLYDGPTIVIDMGTATKLMVVDKDKRMIGGVILPGLGISMDALFRRAALLPAIDLKTPKTVINHDTVACIQSGLVYGSASMIDGLCDRFEEELGYPCTLVGTGGHIETILHSCKRDIRYNETLVLEGLRIIYERVQPT